MPVLRMELLLTCISRASTELRIDYLHSITYRKQRGYTFVQYNTQEDMENAIRNIDNTTLFGCHVEVTRAKNNRRSSNEMRRRNMQ